MDRRVADKGGELSLKRRQFILVLHLQYKALTEKLTEMSTSSDREPDMSETRQYRCGRSVLRAGLAEIFP